MEIENIKSFTVLADCLNFTNAARKLYISQSALSHQISVMEQELNVKLFHRDKRRVELTNAGAHYLPYAFEILSVNERALKEMKKYSSEVNHSFNIGYLSGTLDCVLIQMIKEIRERYPDIILSVNGYGLSRIKKLISSNKLDMAFTVGNLHNRALAASDYESIKIGEEVFMAILPRGHRLANEKQIELKMLKDENFIGLDRQINYDVEEIIIKLCREAGFFPNIISTSCFIDDIPMLVAAGMGVALLPESKLTDDTEEVISLPVKTKIKWAPRFAVWKKDNINLILKEAIDILLSNKKCI